MYAQKDSITTDAVRQIELIRLEAQTEIERMYAQSELDREKIKADAQVELDREIAHVRKREELLHMLLVEAERRIERLDPGRHADDHNSRRPRERASRSAGGRGGRSTRERDDRNADERNGRRSDERNGGRSSRERDDRNSNERNGVPLPGNNMKHTRDTSRSKVRTDHAYASGNRRGAADSDSDTRDTSRSKHRTDQAYASESRRGAAVSDSDSDNEFHGGSARRDRRRTPVGDMHEDDLGIEDLAGKSIGAADVVKWGEGDAAGELQRSVERVRAELRLAKSLQVNLAFVMYVCV